MKWLLCFMIGLIVGFIGFCNNLAVENLAGIKFVTTSNMMLERRYYLCSLEIFNFFFLSLYAIITFLFMLLIKLISD
jgi:chloride channel 7